MAKRSRRSYPDKWAFSGYGHSHKGTAAMKGERQGNGIDGKNGIHGNHNSHSSHQSHDSSSSPDRSRILPPRGDYQTLHSFQKAEVVYDITFRFAHKYLVKGDRTVDQMIQSARFQGAFQGTEVCGPGHQRFDHRKFRRFQISSGWSSGRPGPWRGIR